LCIHSSDKSSLAIGMAGLVGEHLQHGRVQEASRLASEYMALVESIDDPTLTVGAARASIHAKLKTGEVADVLRWSQSVIDLAGGDPDKAISSWAYRWPQRWYTVALPDSIWASPGGDRTSIMPSPWHAGPIRQRMQPW